MEKKLTRQQRRKQQRAESKKLSKQSIESIRQYNALEATKKDGGRIIRIPKRKDLKKIALERVKAKE